jgi:hypothetical protein
MLRLEPFALSLSKGEWPQSRGFRSCFDRPVLSEAEGLHTHGNPALNSPAFGPKQSCRLITRRKPFRPYKNKKGNQGSPFFMDSAARRPCGYRLFAFGPARESQEAVDFPNTRHDYQVIIAIDPILAGVWIRVGSGISYQKVITHPEVFMHAVPIHELARRAAVLLT